MSARAAFALFLATATAALQEEISLMHVAQLASQDVVADKWPAEGPDASSLLCATPSRVGHVTKNPNIRHTPFVTPLAEVVELTKDLRMPLYAGCQVFVSDEWRFIYVRNPKSSSTHYKNDLPPSRLPICRKVPVLRAPTRSPQEVPNWPIPAPIH